MIVTSEEINAWDTGFRSKFTHSLSGYSGVHLIGSKSMDGSSHLAISTSVVFIESESPRIGFIIKPSPEKNSAYYNIMVTRSFTLNHVHKSLVEQAHFTGVNLESGQSQFEFTNLTEVYHDPFEIPFVGESTVKIGLTLTEDIEIKGTDSRLIVGEVVLVETNEDYVLEDGLLDLGKANDVCASGLNQYSSVKKFKHIPIATKESAPNFKTKKRPDNVVFDEDTQSYNASLLPYGTNIGAPSIQTTDLSTWKSNGVNSFNHVLKSKIENIKEEYHALLEEYEINQMVYKSKYEFEPIIGEVYHLYERDNTNENFLSIISPETWKRKHLGSFKLNSEKVWSKIKNENVRSKETITSINS